MNNWFDLMITIFRPNTKTLVDTNQFFAWAISISVWSINISVWSLSFLYDQSKIIRFTENFWGSGSYTKTVRHNRFFIYRIRIWRTFLQFLGSVVVQQGSMNIYQPNSLHEVSTIICWYWLLDQGLWRPLQIHRYICGWYFSVF